ncbi:MAG: alkaline phosphatase PhoX [Gammaproteobacteria bacterium]
MSRLDRRGFFRGVAAAASGAAFAGPFSGFLARAALAAEGGPLWPGFAGPDGGYGPLSPVAEIDGKGTFLALPEGFEYRLLSTTGDPMSDGIPTPSRADGMAAFVGPRGTIRLVRNHEVIFETAQPAGGAANAGSAYDPRSGGGTSHLDIDPRSRELVGHWLSLHGTNFNCAGGLTPWGSWLTCEETVNGPDANRTFLGTTINLAQQHGYLFEVPADRGPGELVRQEPILAAGRFTHEAVAVDPTTGIVYETQDDFAGPSGFFRYIAPIDPRTVKRLEDGGTLQVLSVSPQGSTEVVDLSGLQDVGATFRARWVTIPEANPTFPTGIENDPAAAWMMSMSGSPRGAAHFSRLEGIWYGKRRMFFSSTQGGTPGDPTGGPTSGFGRGFGQVWMYDLDRQLLTLVFASPSKAVLDMPDNLTLTPRGAVLLCEDSPEANRLRVLTPTGRLFDFAQNIFSADEFAGATFSPNGQTLFVNTQASIARTFAIWGPFRRGAL